MQMEREEGELTDEDLEDVSDNSSLSIVPFVLLGKSPPLSTNRAPFRELSLTSVSDESEENKSVLEKNRTNYRIVSTRNICRRHCKYRREDRDHSAPSKRTRRITERPIIRNRTNNRKQYSSVSSSSSAESDSFVQDSKILRQLRDAVRISSSRSLPNCSLRTRLKRMIEPESQGSKNSNSEEEEEDDDDDDDDLEALRVQALQSKVKNDSPAESANDTITDEDLINLRLIALKSAMIKKHQDRRRRKEEQNKLLEQAVITNGEQEQGGVPDNVSNGPATATATDTHGTDATVEHEEANVILDKPQTETQTIPQDAIIANSDAVAHKADENTAQNNNKNIDEDEDILRAMLLTSISKKIANKKQQLGNQLNNNIAPKQIVPVAGNATIAPPSPAAKRLTERTTLKLPPAPVNRIVINVNSDSESDTEQMTVVPKKAASTGTKPNDLFDKSLALFLKQARAKSETEHQSDIAKHLPRSQQLEYRRLKRKLQQMSNKLKPTAKSKRADDVLLVDENKRMKLTSVICNRSMVRSTNGVGAVIVVPSSLTTTNTTTTTTTTITTITATETGRNVLRNIRELRNEKSPISGGGRLQVKGKYEELTPLMTRVSEARDARDKAQVQVKQLINDLRIARAALTSSHQTYSVLMQRLVKAKDNIDKRLDDDQAQRNRKTNNCPPAICTSTPNKTTALPDNTCELSRIEQNVCTDGVRQTTDDVCHDDGDTVQVTEIHTVQPMDIVDEAEEDDGGDDDDDVVVVVVEPHVIEETGLQPQDGCNIDILRYTSPLDHIQPNRETTSANNPLLVLCPYDLLGECRDPDCSYRHCGSAIIQ